MRIYHVSGTRSVRPIWLCYELDLPVEIETIDFSPAFRNSPAWRAISPAGKVPVLSDGALTMFESGAMVDHILDRYGHGRLRPPPGTDESALFHQWCWFAEATLARPVGLNRLITQGAAPGYAAAADAEDKARASLAVVDQALARHDYLLGAQFSAADIMMGYSLQLMESLKMLGDRFAHVRTYLDRLASRPAFVRAMSA